MPSGSSLLTSMSSFAILFADIPAFGGIFAAVDTVRGWACSRTGKKERVSEDPPGFLLACSRQYPPSQSPCATLHASCVGSHCAVVRPASRLPLLLFLMSDASPPRHPQPKPRRRLLQDGAPSAATTMTGEQQERHQ